MDGEWQGTQPGMSPGQPPLGPLPPDVTQQRAHLTQPRAIYDPSSPGATPPDATQERFGPPPVFSGPDAPVQYVEPSFPAPVFPGQPVTEPGRPMPGPGLGPTPFPPPQQGNNKKPLILVAAAVAALLGIGAVAFAVTSGGDDDSSAAAPGKRNLKSLAAGGNPIAPCPTAPTVTTTGYRKQGGQLIASVRLTASCADGDVLSSDATRVAIAQPDGNVAAAMFNFAGNPLVLAGPNDAPVDLEFCFNAPDYWRLPDTLNASTANVLVENVGRSSTTQADAADIVDDYGQICPSGGALPQAGDAESASEAGLQAMRSDDAGKIRALGDVWVPQVSTKRYGLVYDNITWHHQQILGEQYYFRERYPQTALLWTGDFRSYNDPTWWGSVVLLPSSTPGPALDWCRAQGFDKDHCFAKRINASGTANSNAYQ